MQIISTTDELVDLCDRYACSDFITVDTEFLRESTYWPKLCLVQIGMPGDAAIIDVLADGIDLSPLFSLMANDKVLKVFHAARQDIEIFWHLSGDIPTPIFDTQVAAMVCGYGDSISYDQLVNRIVGEAIDKSARFTDWSQRPLSNKQLTYALADVTHLRDIYQHIAALLKQKERAHWVAEEMAVLTSVSTYDIKPVDAWQRLKLRIKKPRELAVMQGLAAWREAEAQNRDVPRSRVCKDDLIYEVATQQPVDEAALGRLRSVPKGFERSKSGQALLEVVRAGVAIAKSDLPKLPKGRMSPEGAGAITELLKVLLKRTAERHGVAAKVLATVDDLERIAADDNADVAALRGWRRDLFGQEALKLKHGRLALSFDGKQVVMIDIDPNASAAAQ